MVGRDSLRIIYTPRLPGGVGSFRKFLCRGDTTSFVQVAVRLTLEADAPGWGGAGHSRSFGRKASNVPHDRPLRDPGRRPGEAGRLLHKYVRLEDPEDVRHARHGERRVLDRLDH